MKTKHLVVNVPFIDHMLARGDYRFFTKSLNDNSPRMREMRALYVKVEGDREAFISKSWTAYRVREAAAIKYYNRVKKLLA